MSAPTTDNVNSLWWFAVLLASTVICIDYCVMGALKHRQFRSTDACMVPQFPNYLPQAIYNATERSQFDTFAVCPHTSMWYDLLPVDGVTISNGSAPPTSLGTKSPGVVFFFLSQMTETTLDLILSNGNDKIVTNVGIHFSRKKIYLI
jgi:hypothetical protein